MLGIDVDADFAVLRRAYRARAMECHPDRHGGDASKEDAFKLLVEAFNILSDPVKRRDYDERLGIAAGSPGRRKPAFDMGVSADDASAILDTLADDILEELIVENSIDSKSTSLATLMLDLERTEKFCMFREAKTHLYRGKTVAAESLLKRYVVGSPDNILGHYFLAKCFRANGKWIEAEKQLLQAIRIGSRRVPPLQMCRVRRELAAMRERQPGLLGLFRRLFGPAIPTPIKPSVVEQERRALNRAINRLAKEREKRRKSLRNGSCWIVLMILSCAT